MKQTWDKLWTELTKFHEKIDDLFAVIPQSNELYKKKLACKRSWDKVKQYINEVDSYITPIESITVVIPDAFNNDKFIEKWQFFKDYLEEQHQIKLKSRREIVMLKQLIKDSDKDVEKAIELIDYNIWSGWKVIWPIIKTNNKNKKNEKSDADFDGN